MTDPLDATGRIVVGIDGSEPSAHALRWARYLASTTGAALTLVTAWQQPITWSSTSPMMPPIDLDPAEDARRILDDIVADVFGADRPDGLELSVRNGDSAQVLIDAAEGASMLVVGSRGHGTVAGLILGSVSSSCVERAPAPVLVVRADTPPPPG